MFRSIRSAMVLVSLHSGFLLADTNLKPEAQCIALAKKLYDDPAFLPPGSPEEIIRFQKDGEADLAIGSLLIRWMTTSLAQGFLPDEHIYARFFKDFKWDETGVLEMQRGGIPSSVMKTLAEAKPLGLTFEAQDRLAKEGVELLIIKRLSAPLRTTSLPDQKRLGSYLLSSALGGSPMAQDPRLKAQMEAGMKQAEQQMASMFNSKKIREEMWEKVLDGWRSHIHTGQDLRFSIIPVQTEVQAQANAQQTMQQMAMLNDASALNNQFLKSTPIGTAIDVAQILSLLSSKQEVLIRAKDPSEATDLTPEDALRFVVRKKPSDLALIHLEESPVGPSAKFTKGVFFGLKMKPASDPIECVSTQDGGTWTLKPKTGSSLFQVGRAAGLRTLLKSSLPARR